MCTVPMATHIEDCEKICQLVQDTGLKYMMAETGVYSREFLFIKECIPKENWGRSNTWQLRIRKIWMAGRSTGSE